MRVNTDLFLQKAYAYFKDYFDKQCDILNIEHIKDYQIGYIRETLSASSEYPACLTLILRKNAVDCYTSHFDCSIAVALTADDMASLGKLGIKWADILENAIRADYHLGGACLDILEDFSITISAADDLQIIACEFTAVIDLGGYVYEEEPRS